jgi:hypothetical protein
VLPVDTSENTDWHWQQMILQVQSCLSFLLVLTMIVVLDSPSVLTIALHKVAAQNTPTFLMMEQFKHKLQQQQQY